MDTPSISLAKLAIAARMLTNAGETARRAYYEDGPQQAHALAQMRHQLDIAAKALGLKICKPERGK